MRMLLAAAALAAGAVMGSAPAARAAEIEPGFMPLVLPVQFGPVVRPDCGSRASRTPDGRCREDRPPFRFVRPDCGRGASSGPDGRCHADRRGYGRPDPDRRYGRPRYDQDFDDAPPPPPPGYRYGRPRSYDPDED